MGTDIAVIENQLTELEPKFAEVMHNLPMDPARIKRTVLVSMERLPALMNCSPVSIMQSAWTAAVLGLEVDGVTGQAYMIPFGGRATLIIGYKGFNTLAARAGYTVTAGCVREGDGFEYEKGSQGYVRHKPKLGNKGKIIAAWACASHHERPPIVEILSIDELMAVKQKSPGARKKDSPWNDPGVGFAAMCEKTARRRLARSMPLNVMQQAAAIDEAVEERGHRAYIDDNKEIVIEAEDITEMQPEPADEVKLNEGPVVPRVLLSDGSERSFDNVRAWRDWLTENMGKMKSREQLDAFVKRNNPIMQELHNAGYADDVNEVLTMLTNLQRGI